MKALVLRRLEKWYDQVHAVKGIDLEIAAGDFFGLLGPNGAGKSTTIGMITSLIRKTAGKVCVFGHDLDQSPEKVKAQLGLVPQEFNFNIFERCIDILVNQAGYYGIPYAQALENAHYYLDRLGLSEKALMPARTLSGGLKRRLLMARGLVHQPKLLILDEPTAGVDIALRRSILDFLEEINQKGVTIILTTHYLEEAERLCRNVAIINQGSLVTHASVKALIASMHRETLLLDLKEPVGAVPEVPGFEIAQKEPTVLEVSFGREVSLNTLFEVLSKNHWEVMSLRNKTNRLEELFVYLTQ